MTSSEGLHRRDLMKSNLQQNPFALLGVSTRDSRRRIVELAEEKSLELDHDICQKARSDLTSPRMRLTAEMAWLPGVSPGKARQLIFALQSDPMSLRDEAGLPTLAQLNLLAAAFESVDGSESADQISEFIQELASLTDELSTDQILRDINEDRSVSGFPEINSFDPIEAELAERKRFYRNAIKVALDKLPVAVLVDAMTMTVDEVTFGGEVHAPELIDDLVDSYAVETQGFLQKEAENTDKLINAAREAAASGEEALKPIIEKLELVARNWDKVAQPIQLSAKARGIDHDPSREIARSIRTLAVDLFNEHGMLALSQRLTNLIQELFSEVPEVSDQVEEDLEALADIVRNREGADDRNSEWAREITFHAEIGMIFKETLSISPEGLTWKNQHYPLDSITRIRWGGTRHSVNGIPTGTTYTIAFGDSRSVAVVELRKDSTFSSFIQKLWRAVGVRMLIRILEKLRDGKEMRIGDATIRDTGIVLVKRKFFGSNEQVPFSWQEIRIWSADGSLFIGSKADSKAYVSLPYLEHWNVQVLEQAINLVINKPGARRLSDILR
ncbi:MAG TPA: hypothetical protein PK417_09500 [Hyphomonas sp.]|nr:hypothetical protein [Hyphomonas sp.]HRX72715.1 hypothetical protein [Hyphomonas sp.]